MMSADDRRQDLDRLYGLLAELGDRPGGYKHLRDCNGRMSWPKRGVYFIFEDGELREDGHTPRVVRVGTHAVSARSRTTLWNRLSQHRGTAAALGGGNHRGSIFRLHVGAALLASQPGQFTTARPTWGRGITADRITRSAELDLEQVVSRYIGAMPFLWVAVDDEPSRTSERHVIEANTIALLSNAPRPRDPARAPVDRASRGWLGRQAAREEIRLSGLWNVGFVRDGYDRTALDILATRISRMGYVAH
jgi:hypothetical protein